MQILLDLDGINLILGISNYVYSTTWADDLWTKNYVGISSQYINYEINGEIFECFEVTQLKEDLKRLLEGNEPESREISFIEPDLEFKLYPSHTIKSGEDGYVYVAPDAEFVDCYAELIVNLFINGAESGHEINLYVDRENIEKMYNYLRLVTKEIDESNPIIVEYIKTGIMLDFQK